VNELDGRPVHRPERTWPVQPAAGPIVLAAPPVAPEPESGGAWMTLLPLLGSLGIVAFAFVVRSVLYLIVATLMVVAMVGGTLGMRVVQRRRDAERRNRLRRLYLAHAAEAEARAKATAAAQRDGLLGLYPDTPGLLAAARDQRALWERRPAHADFGTVRLGLGPVPAAAPVQVTTDGGPLATPEPELAEVAHRLVAVTRVVPEAPVVVPLRSLSSIAVVGDPPAARALAGSWLASLAAFHAPTDLRVIGWVPRYAARAWEWVKWLPHTRDPLAGEGFGRAERAVTTDVLRFAEQVEALAGPRLGQAARRAPHPEASAPGGGAGMVAEHVVVLVDSYAPDADVAAVKHLDTLLERGAELAVTVIALVDDPARVPSTCGARIELAPDGTATYREAGPDGRAELAVSADQMDRAAAEQLARWLAPLRLTSADAGADLIDTVRLVDLLGLEHAGQVTPWEGLTVRDLVAGPGPSGAAMSWEAPARDPAELLQTPIGIGADGSPLVLDLKDLAAGGMGPHGILVGATGSGKSELLRSLVTGLAARHDPRLVNLVLVDFKGGAAFADLADLPHTVGLITNLADEPTLVDRMQAALRGELDRRQQLLRDAGNLDSIRDYHTAQAASGFPADLPDLPYLLVIVDEFGELLAAKPEFIDTFVAIGRLGRSMGIHLLLATQRLDEGRIRGLESHLRYRLCLRTFSASESQAVLGSAAAHELPPLPGLGWLRVDTTLTRFKGAICSLPYRPPSRTDLDAATVQPFGLDVAAPGQDLEATVTEPSAGRNSELQVIVDTLAAARVPPPHQVWTPPLPDVLALDQLPASPPGRLHPVVGLLDEPDHQRQGPLALELDGAGGHIALVGAPRTGKSTFLRTLVHAVCGNRSPDQVQIYAIDLGGGSLFDLAGLPHVGAVCGRHEPDAIARLLREVRAVVDERAAAFRAAGVASLTALRASERRAALLPDPLAAETFLLIDNVGLLRTEFTDLELGLAELAATSLQFGVHLVVTAGRWLDIRPALLDAIGTRLELRLNDPVDSQFGRAAAATLPADRPGRGLIRDQRQFQLALPWRPGDAAIPDGRAAVDQAPDARDRWPGRRAPQVRPLPLRVSEADVPDLAAAAGRPVAPGSGFLLGVEEFRLAPVHLDLLAPGAHLQIYGDEGSGRSTILRRAIDHLAGSDPDRVRLHLVDLRRAMPDLADGPHVDHYAFAGSLIQQTAEDLAKLLLDRLPRPDLPRSVLLEGSWWTGPEHVLVVDDYDLTLTGVDGPLGSLTNALGHARDLGFHVLLARRVAGAQRTGFEPFGQRLRELGPPTLLLNGDKGEGPLAGDRAASPQPPGRGLLVRRGRRDALVQCCLPNRWSPQEAER
jgi:DNA segregation ATPase FtsK/SpoIIIE, S-DNA-T family